MLDFKKFYKEVYFDIDKNNPKIYSAKQGDKKTRGFYVQVVAGNQIVPITTEYMNFYARRPDRLDIMVPAVVENGRFRIDIPSDAFAVAGPLRCELTLMGNDEVISDQSFTMQIDESIREGIIVGDEFNVLDEIFLLWSNHRDNISNPHKVTRKQLGVEYSTLAQAIAGTTNDSTMTPLRVKQSVESMTGQFGGGMSREVFLSNGTFLVPDVSHIYITACGGGGGGHKTNRNGGGGGACVIARKTAVSPGQSLAITIGAGGAANASGGITKIGTLLSLSGGTAAGAAGGAGGGAGGSAGAGGGGGAGGGAGAGSAVGTAGSAAGGGGYGCGGGGGGAGGSSYGGGGGGGAGGGGGGAGGAGGVAAGSGLAGHTGGGGGGAGGSASNVGTARGGAGGAGSSAAGGGAGGAGGAGGVGAGVGGAGGGGGGGGGGGYGGGGGGGGAGGAGGGTGGAGGAGGAGGGGQGIVIIEWM